MISVKKRLKFLLLPFYKLFLFLFYPADVTKDIYAIQLSPSTLLKYFFFQKILRVNSHVPWPIHFTTQVLSPEKISRGSRFPGFSISCFIDGRNGIIFGANVWVGPRVTLISQDHDNTDFNVYKKEPPITIGDDCLLTANCILLPGVTLGQHTIVAAGAVVTKSFPEGNQILAGIPARVVKKLPAISQAPKKFKNV